jgi:hypothetical protein
MICTAGFIRILSLKAQAQLLFRHLSFNAIGVASMPARSNGMGASFSCLAVVCILR